MRIRIACLCIALLLPVCKDKVNTGTEIALAKQTAQSYGGALQKQLFEQIKTVGPVKALAFCKMTALPQAEKISLEMQDKVQKAGYTHLAVSRISIKNRNPLNAPNERQAQVLNQWFQDKASGLNLQPNISRTEAETQILLPIILQHPTCLQCHGTAEKMNPLVKTELKKLYPADKATDYALGQVRGSFLVKLIRKKNE